MLKKCYRQKKSYRGTRSQGYRVVMFTIAELAQIFEIEAIVTLQSCNPAAL